MTYKHIAPFTTSCTAIVAKVFVALFFVVCRVQGSAMSLIQTMKVAKVSSILLCMVRYCVQHTSVLSHHIAHAQTHVGSTKLLSIGECITLWGEHERAMH